MNHWQIALNTRLPAKKASAGRTEMKPPLKAPLLLKTRAIVSRHAQARAKREQGNKARNQNGVKQTGGNALP
jgi:hypothetical protein